MTLLREIQAAALDSSFPLPDLLRKCKVLAARLRHREFGEWVSKELNGYKREDELPPYRVVVTQSSGQFSGDFGRSAQNVPIPSQSLPKEFRKLIDRMDLTMSVAALAEMATTDETVLQIRWLPDLIAFVAHNVEIVSGMVLVDASKFLPVSKIKEILDVVRTRILDFVIAIEEEDPTAGDVPPGAPPPIPGGTVTNIFNTTINGGAANIATSGNAQAKAGAITLSSAIPKKDRVKVERLIGKLRKGTEQIIDAEDREEARRALENTERQLALPSPDKTKVVRNLQLYAAIATAAAPTVEALRDILNVLLH